MEGYITYTVGASGGWIAWHTHAPPPANATGRDLLGCEGPVRFAVGPTAEEALVRLRAEVASEPTARGGV